MSDEEKGFVSALAERPDDETARLVYADWLDEQKRFEAAAKLTVAEWGKSDAAEWLYDDRHDKWFPGFEEADEWYEEDTERERPAYLWCTTPVAWKPDASGYIADQLHDNFHEDACDQIGNDEWKRLDAFVTEWWEKQGVVSYQPDFSRCVLLPPAEPKEVT